MLQIKRELPADFLSLHACDLHRSLNGPTLFHLPGKRFPPLFVSIMLHGNEDVGLKAVQQALTAYSGRQLPREMLLLVGNTEAAEVGLRKLPDQLDFNRVWPGSELPPSCVSETMSQVVEYARQVGVFVSIDLHNNTGANPHYGCVNRVDAKSLQLAALFARTVVYFERPLGVQSAAMTKLCPSITCECGQVGDTAGVTRAAHLLEACLQMLELPDRMPLASDYHLLRTIATIKVDSTVRFGFDPQDPELEWLLPFDIALRNFRPLPAGTGFGWRRTGSTSVLLSVINEQDEMVTDDFLTIVNEEVVLNQCAVPSMLTTNMQIIRDDCLGYFMEEYAPARLENERRACETT